MSRLSPKVSKQEQLNDKTYEVYFLEIGALGLVGSRVVDVVGCATYTLGMWLVLLKL